jgi:glycosyltransferase involved in cell wall biosynthesis
MLTIYTITYNRADLLERLYMSILKAAQAFPFEFEWLVINNGCTDSTDQLLMKIESEGLLKIRIHQIENNVGFTRADNIARELTKREYSSRIDDDDLLKENYFNLFAKYEGAIKYRDNICGIMFNCVDQNQLLVGSSFPVNESLANDFEIYHLGKLVGDKVRIYKSAIRDRYLSEAFDDEQLVPTELVYNRMGLLYKHLCVNEAAIVREYYPNGITASQSNRVFIRDTNGILLNLIELIRNPAGTLLLRFLFRLRFLKRCFLANMNFHQLSKKADGDYCLIFLGRVCFCLLIPNVLRSIYLKLIIIRY